jgi:membrane-bound lytic murein transglycosylase A
METLMKVPYTGKPMIQHLLRCQGIGVNDCSRTPELVERDALHLQHPRLLQRQGVSGTSRMIKAVFLVALLFISACVPEVRPPVEAPQVLVKLRPDQFPNFSDDMPFNSLETAIDQSLEYLNRIDPSTSFRCGRDLFTASHLAESLNTFRTIIQRRPSSDELQKAITASFWVYKSVGRDGHGEVLFTGYYEPVLRASRVYSVDFPFPIYKKPDDWVSVDLKAFSADLPKKRIVGRLIDQTVVPYFSRKEIDTKGRLLNKNYELLWVTDQIDLFFLQIQGSGKAVFDDGAIERLNYACSNGRAYRSIGKLLIEEGKITKEEMSLQQIRSYLRSHPEDVERVLNHNESYVFFRFVDDGPLGAIGVPLTAGRSMATDLRLFPRAVPAFVQTEKPLMDESGLLDRWMTFGRFVLNQDTGGAIRGPGRVDIYWGSGPYAEFAAGHMKQKGTLFFLVQKLPEKKIL